MNRIVYTLILMAFGAISLYAQQNAITPPIKDEVAVGAIGGNVDISALGGATYTIPIQVPDGTDGMQPNLSIVYNSQSGNGLLGWGWNLGGLSAITRVGQTNYHDGRVYGVSFDYHDRFALDGQRLIVLDGDDYGADNAEYKTEVDGMSKIVSYNDNNITNGPGHFKVWTPDGLIMEYGNSSDSKLAFGNTNQRKVGMWLLNKVTDRNGNYMTFQYNNDDESVSIAKIFYSMREGVLGCYSVNFDYESRTDVELSFIGGHAVTQKDLLSSIQIKWWDRELWKYDFYYDDDISVGTPKYYNRLEQVVFSQDGLQYNPTNISWGEIPEVTYNYPSPAYGDDDYNDYTTKIHVNNTSIQASELSNKQKFVGDFNGDGLSDFITVFYENITNHDGSLQDSLRWDYSSMSDIQVLVNKGHNKSDTDCGVIDFDTVYRVSMSFNELYPFLPAYGVTSSIYDLKWIYVCDFDGDGMDDFVLYRKTNTTIYLHAFKACFDNEGNFTFTKIPWGLGSTTTYCYTNTTENEETLLVGDFMGTGRQDLIYVPSRGSNNNPMNFVYFRCHYGVRFFIEEANSGMKGKNFVAADFNGDGKTEIWFAYEDEQNDGKIVSIYKNEYSNNKYSWTPILDNFLNSKYTLFTGDFNGDGRTDILSYQQRNGLWTMYLFTSNDCHFTSYNVGTVLGLLNADPGNYQYSIEGRKSGMLYVLQVADFNGDGKSDVAVINNDEYFKIVYSPIYSDVQFGNTFSNTDFNIRLQSAGLEQVAYSCICVGNFLGQENASMFFKDWLYSKCSMTTYYNVASITDGMGNRTSFGYDYLVHNPMKEHENHDDNIYTLTDIGRNLGYDIYHTPLPIKAASWIGSENIHLETGSIAVDSCSYQNAMIHRLGKGLLGFGKVTLDKWLIQKANKTLSKHQSKTTNTNSFVHMGEHRMLVPDSKNVYRYKDDGEEVITDSTRFRYCKALSNRDLNPLGSKVFAPLTTVIVTDEYELLGERGHLRRRITENKYNGSQQLSGTINYPNALRVTESRQGTDPNSPLQASSCEFQTVTQTEYAASLNSGNLWMPNRPLSVYSESTRLTSGYADSKSLTTYSYDIDKPYLPRFVTTYPSGVENANDPLAMVAYYTYYSTGQLEDESHYPIGRSEDGFKISYEYSQDGRFLTRKTEEYDLSPTCDYVTEYEYNNAFGNLIVETDCNGFSTFTENPDHLGLTVRSYKRDRDISNSRIAGTESVKALRWLTGSAYAQHAPNSGNPSYYSWKKDEDSAETVTIYDAAGRKLRTVSYGLRNTGSNVVYQDTQYDLWGRVARTSEPYFSDASSNSIKWTTYEYGDFDRIAQTNPPAYVQGGNTVSPFTSVTYDGLITTTETGVVIGQSKESHTTETAINVMGWMEYNKEYLDSYLLTFNTTTYGYNADGSLAWAKVNGDETTKISMAYDNAGNRIELHDPDYGTMSSRYDAFGRLRWQETPKGDSTTYQYDNMGRLALRIETDNSTGHPINDTTSWTYSNAVGTKGLLTSIVLGDRQMIAYTYDSQHYNNLTQKTEELFGTDYFTTYAYNDVDFPLRVSSVTYPSGYSVARSYNTITGDLDELHHNNQLLWKTSDANAMGQITRFEMGNGVHSYYQYDDRHHLAAQQASKNGNTIQNFGYVYDFFGNLAARTEDKFIMPNTESFSYDYLNRLRSITLNGTLISNMGYDAHGRILLKEADGQTVFSNAQYSTYDQSGHLKPHAISTASMPSMPNSQIFSPSLEIDYTLFDKVKTLRQYDLTGTEASLINFQYGYNHERIRMEYGKTYQKLYLDNCELITQNGSSQWNTFISGPLGVFAVVTATNNNTEVLRYVYKDHLGSWTTITDDGGSIVQELSFDAWGNYRAPATWSGVYNGLLLYDRGFTSHEHLFDFGLINMNGRMYDPVMSSFLSVDNFVQSPENSQSFNRYAYCLNNPLRYVDPCGEEFITAAIIIGGVIIGAYTGGTLANGGNCNPVQWDWNNKGTYIGMIGGGIAGGLSAGAGLAVAGAGFSFCNTTAIATSSLIYSGGMHITGLGAGFDYDISVSIGAASYNFTKGEFGYLFKKNNSVWDNIGYGLGAITNMSDIYRFATWDVLSKQQRYNKLEKWAAKKHGEQNMEYVPNMGKDHANYNVRSDKIQISDLALSQSYGCAKSCYLHELNHRMTMPAFRDKIELYAMLSQTGNQEAKIMLDKYYAAFDAYAYESELIHAAQNGLTLRQFDLNRNCYLYNSSLGGISANKYNYTLWQLLKSTLFPYW